MSDRDGLDPWLADRYAGLGPDDDAPWTAHRPWRHPGRAPVARRAAPGGVLADRWERRHAAMGEPVTGRQWSVSDRVARCVLWGVVVVLLLGILAAGLGT